MFKFFVLSNSGSGEARRHFPFRSLIHKHVLPLFFVLVVFLFSSVPVSVSASSVPVEFTPVQDAKIEQLKEYVEDVLTNVQRDMFVFLLGTYGAAQAGFTFEKLDTSYSDSSGTVSWLKRFGDKLYNTMVDTMYSPYFQALDVRTYLYRAVDYALGVAKSVRKYSAFQDLLDDIDASTHYFIPVDPELQASINSFVGLSNGFYDWQFDSGPFETTDFTKYLHASLTSVQQNNQDSVTSNWRRPLVRYTNNVSRYNGLVSDSYFSNYNLLFINTTSNTFSVVNSSGQTVGSGPYSSYAYFNYYSNGTLDNTCTTRDIYLNFPGMYGTSFISANYTQYVNLVRDIFNNSTTASSSFDSITFIAYSDWIEHVYVGSNWATKHEIFNISDLNFVANESPSYDQISTELLIDIKGFLSDLIDEVDLHTVILNNLFNPDGTLNVSPLTTNVSVEFPSSGVTVPPSLFSGFFTANDGFISYLWYMTKPLVVYTHDLLDCFWFGPEGGFEWSGPAPIVFGVVSLGLIGGLIVKMLL